MRLPELHAAMVRAAETQEAAAPPTRRRLLSPRTLIVLVACLVLAGTAAGAVLSLTRSRPLTGSINPGPNGGSSLYSIQVFPMMTVGWSGWCIEAEFAGTAAARATAYGCGAVEDSGPLVAGGDEFASSDRSYTFGIVREDVASVRLPEGKIVMTVADARLPVGTRAYFSPTHVIHKLPSRTRAVTFLDARGRPIGSPSQTAANAVRRLPVRTQLGGNPLAGKCTITVRPLPSLRLLSETVAEPEPWPRGQSGALLSCANATFRLGEATIGLARLVSSTAPSRSAPNLPSVIPDPHHPGLLVGVAVGNLGFPAGVFVADFGGEQPFSATPAAAAYSGHDVSARSAGSGWLVAEGGTPTQRALLLARVSDGGRRPAAAGAYGSAPLGRRSAGSA